MNDSTQGISGTQSLASVRETTQMVWSSCSWAGLCAAGEGSSTTSCPDTARMSMRQFSLRQLFSTDSLESESRCDLLTP